MRELHYRLSLLNMWVEKDGTHFNLESLKRLTFKELCAKFKEHNIETLREVFKEAKKLK